MRAAVVARFSGMRKLEFLDLNEQSRIVNVINKNKT